MRQNGLIAADVGVSDGMMPSRLARLAGVSALALVLANCANQPQRSASHHSREIGAFSHPKYGKASPRVVGLDEDAPKGGGRYQVGNPYAVAGRRYVPREYRPGATFSGNASWYGVAFHGRKTANGEIYDRKMISAAHPTMPLPSYARVTNMANSHSIIVRVNDRGPYHGGRVIDVSERTAELLRFRHMGTARVKVDYLGPASLAGSSDEKLVASLRTDGPALPVQPGLGGAVTMVASAEPAVTPRAFAASGNPASAPLFAFAATEAPVVAPVPAPVSAPASAPPPRAAASGDALPASRAVPVAGMPLPPARPFDLDTIGGAARPVAPGSLPSSANRRISDAGLPRHRPTDLAFSEESGVFSRFGKDHPFSKIGVLETFRITGTDGR